MRRISLSRRWTVALLAFLPFAVLDGRGYAPDALPGHGNVTAGFVDLEFPFLAAGRRQVAAQEDADTEARRRHLGVRVQFLDHVLGPLFDDVHLLVAAL